jgi:signal transduction histidine kinase
MSRRPDEPPRKPMPPPKRKRKARLDNARRIIEEYADDLRELIRKLRQRLH